MRRTTGSADGSPAYFCGWAITGRSTVSHLVASAEFPIAGSRHRAWCGQTITVIALTLDARGVPGNCTDCNQQLRMLTRECDVERLQTNTDHGRARRDQPR